MTESKRSQSHTMNAIQAAVVTISDKGYTGEREDVSGPILADLVREMGADVVRRSVVPDEREEIIRLLVNLADETGVDLVMTTGGTGVTPRDVTPEATRAVIKREMPGLAEVLRFEGYRKTPLAVISRGVAGIRGQTLIVNLPGNPKAVREGMETLTPILPHAVQMIRGEETEHDHTEEG
jgi:molybdenum cofactor synthesis domain-containing protein